MYVCMYSVLAVRKISLHFTNVVKVIIIHYSCLITGTARAVE